MTIITFIIIGITSLVSIMAFNNTRFIDRGAFSVHGILANKEFYRIITSMFLHANYAHLIFNMFSFYSFGASLESYFGWKTLLVLYFASAAAGDLLALAIKRKEPGYSAIGASGAVSGVIFASIFLTPGMSIIIFPLPIPMPSWLFAFLFTGISIYGIGRGNTGIGHEAHIGGALGGIITACILNPAILESQTFLLVAVSLPVIILLALFIFKPEVIEGLFRR